MEEVECAECSNRYDSDEHPFCPRCGNVGSAGPPPADYRPQRYDPGRRRAKLGGLILAIVGTCALLLLGYTAVVPPQVDDEQLELLAGVDAFASQPGGTLHLRLLSNGTPVEANVTIMAADGDPMALQTQDGWANATVPAAFGNVTIVSSSHNATFSYYVPSGATVRQDIDLDDPPAWVALRDFQAVRVLAGFMAFFAAFVVLGGVLAMLLKAWRVALSAAVVATVPGVMLLFLIPMAGLLFLLPPGLALAFIAMGRRHFH